MYRSINTLLGAIGAASMYLLGPLNGILFGIGLFMAFWVGMFMVTSGPDGRSKQFHLEAETAFYVVLVVFLVSLGWMLHQHATWFWLWRVLTLLGWLSIYLLLIGIVGEAVETREHARRNGKN